MFDLKTLEKMNREVAENAKENDLEPLIAKCDGDRDVVNCPDLGSYEPDGWEYIQNHFVDNSGFGQEGEPALTLKQFLARVKEGLGYSICGAGQFQVNISEWKKQG